MLSSTHVVYAVIHVYLCAAGGPWSGGLRTPYDWLRGEALMAYRMLEPTRHIGPIQARLPRSPPLLFRAD